MTWDACTSSKEGRAHTKRWASSPTVARRLSHTDKAVRHRAWAWRSHNTSPCNEYERTRPDAKPAMIRSVTARQEHGSPPVVAARVPSSMTKERLCSPSARHRRISPRSQALTRGTDARHDTGARCAFIAQRKLQSSPFMSKVNKSPEEHPTYIVPSTCAAPRQKGCVASSEA